MIGCICLICEGIFIGAWGRYGGLWDCIDGKEKEGGFGSVSNNALSNKIR